MSVGPEVQVAGLVLCRVAGNRLAFPASQVVTVQTWSPGEPFPHARSAFGLAAERGRVLLGASGDAVAVDAIEVLQDTVSLMPAPALLLRVAAGSLVGFAHARQELWPVLRVKEFSHLLLALAARPAGGETAP